MSANKNLNYKLHYFNCRGYAEPIRLIFHYNSIPFEEVRFTHFFDGQPDWFEKWQTLKQSFPYRQAPVLEMDGPNGQRVMLCQSQTICRFLANKYGLAGNDEFEQAKADELAEYWKDIWMPLIPFYLTFYEVEKGNLEELHQKDLIPAIYEKFVPILSKTLKESGSSGFILPSGLSWTDFLYAETCITFNAFEEGKLFKKHPELGEYVKRVHSANEPLRKYIAGRPEYKL